MGGGGGGGEWGGGGGVTMVFILYLWFSFWIISNQVHQEWTPETTTKIKQLNLAMKKVILGFMQPVKFEFCCEAA